MASKRKTLPKDFEEIVKQGDITLQKAVFDKCDINAYGGFWKGNALTFPHLTVEYALWLSCARLGRLSQV